MGLGRESNVVSALVETVTRLVVLDKMADQKSVPSACPTGQTPTVFHG